MVENQQWVKKDTINNSIFHPNKKNTPLTPQKVEPLQTKNVASFQMYCIAKVESKLWLSAGLLAYAVSHSESSFCDSISAMMVIGSLDWF